MNRLIPKPPSVDYSWIRKRMLTLNPSSHDSLRGLSSPIAIAVDSSCVSISLVDGLRAYTARRSTTSRSTSQ
ncbi:MAG: hypothetical protein QXP91_00520 [Candidatus Methanomethylicia archaeon]